MKPLFIENLGFLVHFCGPKILRNSFFVVRQSLDFFGYNKYQVLLHYRKALHSDIDYWSISPKRYELLQIPTKSTDKPNSIILFYRMRNQDWKRGTILVSKYMVFYLTSFAFLKARQRSTFHVAMCPFHARYDQH